MNLRVLNHLSDLRSLHYLIIGNPFLEAFAGIDALEKKKVEELVDLCCSSTLEVRNTAKDKLKDWLRQHDKSEISCSELRNTCQSYGVRNYSRLTKVEMIIELERVKSILAKQSKGNTDGRAKQGSSNSGDSTIARQDSGLLPASRISNNNATVS